MTPPDNRNETGLGAFGLVKREKKKVGRVLPKGRPMRWASLHGHSTYSYLDGYGLPEDHMERAGDLQISAMALTEHGNIASHVKLEMAAEKLGVKPIYGCEFYASPGRTQKKNHLTVLAATDEGYQNLLRLSSEAASEENFYYRPTLSGRSLNENRTGLLVLSGCLTSQLADSLVGGVLVEESEASYARGREVARRYRNALGDSYYLECQAFPELEKTRSVNGQLARISEELKIPLVATMDTHYPLPEHRELQAILHNLRSWGKETLEEQTRRWGYNVPLCFPERDSSIVERLIGTGLTRSQAQAAVLNTEEIAQRCNVTLPRHPTLRYPCPDGKTAKQVWLEELRAGWAYRGFEALTGKARADYQARVKREREIIESKDFLDYFLLVGDVVRWAKDQGIPVGPARGSAAASLLCYLLRITEVNPMQFPDLVFERFIDVTRADLPDIDLDFASSRRGELYDYLVAKYGAECVANVGTFQMYKSKNSLDDVARVFKVPKWDIDRIKDVLIERSSGDLRASATIEDTIEQFAQAREVFELHPDLHWASQLEGNVKGVGVHAAGLIVSNGPLSHITAVTRKVVAGHLRDVITFDKYDSERQGLLKMDFLALNTMDLIDECLKATGMTLPELYKLPLDDEKVIDGFRRNDVIGIFQFEGRAMRSVCGAIRPDNFKEICDVNALARPGPLHNGSSNEYIDIKSGVAQPERIHPMLDHIVATTNYQIVYQEQILKIVTEIGNFDWTAASYIRKIISKKLGEQEFNRQWDKFRSGAVSNGMDEATARRIWGACITAGAYAFNYAHCCAYGMLGYWAMHFKVYHPSVFFAAALRYCAGSKEKELSLLRDTKRHERTLEILPPDIALSAAEWRPEGEQQLRMGFNQIPGIADKTSTQILAWRGEREDLRWSDLAEVKGIGKKTIEKIYEFTVHSDPLGIFKLRNDMGKVMLFIDEHGLPQPTHTAAQIPYERVESRRNLPVVWLGAVVDRNLRDLFESNMARTGVALDPSEVKDPDKNEWCIMLGVDEDEQVSITVDRYLYSDPFIKELVWGLRPGRDLVLVQGYKKWFQTARKIYVTNIWIIDPEDDEEEDGDAF